MSITSLTKKTEQTDPTVFRGRESAQVVTPNAPDGLFPSFNEASSTCDGRTM